MLRGRDNSVKSMLNVHFFTWSQSVDQKCVILRLLGRGRKFAVKNFAAYRSSVRPFLLLLCAVQNGQNGEVLAVNSVRKDKWGIGDHEFAGSGLSSRAPFVRMNGKRFSGGNNSFGDAPRRLGFIAFDIRTDDYQVADGFARPDYFQRGGACS